MESYWHCQSSHPQNTPFPYYSPPSNPFFQSRPLCHEGITIPPSLSIYVFYKFCLYVRVLYIYVHLILLKYSLSLFPPLLFSGFTSNPGNPLPLSNLNLSIFYDLYIYIPVVTVPQALSTLKKASCNLNHTISSLLRGKDF